ncbi:hypothetical protein D3C73_962000 [compost metagenome]
MIRDVIGNCFESGSLRAQFKAADVGLHQAEHLAGDDLRVMLLHPGNLLGGLGFLADHCQQVDEAFQLIELITVLQKPHTLPRIAPALLIADGLEQMGGDFEDEFFAIGGIGQVHRIVGVDQQ